MQTTPNTLPKILAKTLLKTSPIIKPILYSYRRCPYAMRARMALDYANIQVEIRDIQLRDKPQHMLSISPKGTVPVLILPDGHVYEQSLDIMHWALHQFDPQGWLQADQSTTSALITQNDTSFKSALDRYKYPERFPEQLQQAHREDGEVLLQRLETHLIQTQFLVANHMTLADIAIFPFIRQFAAVDALWFSQCPYTNLSVWLNGLSHAELFIRSMQKQPIYQP